MSKAQRLLAQPAVAFWSSTALAIGGEVYLYAAYRAQDARFHWFIHFFAGASAALLVMAAVRWRTRQPLPLPAVWVVLAHLYAMVPDLLFARGIAHARWMDIFLGHITVHFVPGRTLTWYFIFLASLAAYLLTSDRLATVKRRDRDVPDRA